MQNDDKEGAGIKVLNRVTETYADDSQYNLKLRKKYQSQTRIFICKASDIQGVYFR